jgi:hypothetical protein
MLEAAEAQVAGGKGYRPLWTPWSDGYTGIVDHPDKICNDAVVGCKPEGGNQSTELTTKN